MRKIIMFLLAVSIAFSAASTLFAAKGMSDNEKYIRSLYLDIQGREGGSTGIEYWTRQLNQGKKRADVVQAFLNSDEYRTRFVIHLYGWVHDRRPDSVGLEFWSEQMKTITEGKIIVGFCSSDEFWVNSNENNKDFLINLYWTLHRRSPDATGLQYWMGKMDEGMTREQIVGAFIASPEYRERFIRFLYNWFLNRSPEQKGLEHWCDLLKENGERWVIIKILTSDEYWKKATK